MPDRSSLTDRAGDHISGPPSLTGRCGSWAARAATSPNRTGRGRGLGPPRTLLATVVLIAMSTVWEAWAEHEHGTSMHHRANFSGCPSIESLGPTFPKPWTITYGHVCKVGDRLVFGDENGQHYYQTNADSRHRGEVGRVTMCDGGPIPSCGRPPRPELSRESIANPANVVHESELADQRPKQRSEHSSGKTGNRAPRPIPRLR